MAAVHADAAAFSYVVYTQGIENAFQAEEIQNEEKSSILINEPCPCTKEDFIVFAEFSEVTGPIPLFTVPSKLACEDIDMNVLIMKIMSSDYQTSPSGQFAVSQDVQILQHGVLPGWHAYVHYCSLHDLRARGFVRPLCIAYFSADHKKLHDNFDTIRQKFSEAAEIMKYNNRQTFIGEISKVLTNLKQIQSKYFFWKKKEEDGEYLTPDEHRAMDRTQIDQLAHQYTELHHMLLAVEPLMGSKELEFELEKWWHAMEESPEEECSKFVFKVKQPCVLLASAASVGPTSLREPLRSVPALSPWGTAAMLWHLLCIQRSQGLCRLQTSLSMFISESKEEQDKYSPAEALADSDFLQLLQSTLVSIPWPNIDNSLPSSSPPIEVLSPESLEYMEANLVASGNEASSSYHSAPESLSELMTAVRPDDELALDNRSPSVESFLDVPSDSDSGDEVSPEEDDGFLPNVWMCCPWKHERPLGVVAGKRLFHFFQRYSRAAQHIVYSLLMGRTVVLAAGESLRTKVRTLLVALTVLMPSSPQSVLWWHRGILVSSHVSTYRLIGICVPERLSVHDMISPRDKNLVTILEVVSGRLWGPAYSGQLLKPLDNVPTPVFSDQTLLFFLRSIGDKLREKLFILRKSVVSLPDTLARMGLTGCDADILKYLMQIGLVLEDNHS